jgi:hypothetical protein
MVPSRRLPAHRARHRIVPGPRRHPDDLALVRHALDDGRQARKHHIHKLADIAHTMPTTAVTLRYHRLRDRAERLQSRTVKVVSAVHEESAELSLISAS